MKLIISTGDKKEVVDITSKVEDILGKSNIKDGICNLHLMHTTAALTTADLDPGTDLDLVDAFVEIIPKLKYRHPHNPAHVPDHIASSLIGTSISLPFENKKLILGTWQRVILAEFDGPRERQVVLTIIPINPDVSSQTRLSR